MQYIHTVTYICMYSLYVYVCVHTYTYTRMYVCTYVCEGFYLVRLPGNVGPPSCVGRATQWVVSQEPLGKVQNSVSWLALIPAAFERLLISIQHCLQHFPLGSPGCTASPPETGQKSALVRRQWDWHRLLSEAAVCAGDPSAVGLCEWHTTGSSTDPGQDTRSAAPCQRLW